MPTKENTTNSSGDNMAELERAVSELSSSALLWANWGLWLLILTAAIALATAVVAVKGTRVARDLDTARSKLDSKKEELLKGQLTVTDNTAAEANERAGKANEAAGKANERAAKLEKEAAALRESAESEKLARVKIEERLAWRRITRQQHDKFLPILRPYAGSIIIIRGFDNADIESKTFAGDISKLLTDAGWKAKLDLTSTVSGLPVGLFCRIDNRSSAGKALTIVLEELPGATFTPIQFADGTGIITVGLRPPP